MLTLLGLAVAFAATACDPEEVAPDETQAALVEADPDNLGPDQVGIAEPGQAGYPSGNCRQGFKQAGDYLCIDSKIRQPLTYLRASADCRDSQSQICSVEDLFYLYRNTNLDGKYNPKEGWKQRWLGGYVGNDEALCGDQSITGNNDPDAETFAGECNAKEKHAYWCCHDRVDKKGGGGDDGGWDDDDDGGGWDDDDGGWDDDDGGWDGK